MLFSSKISNSILSFLEGQRSGLEQLYSSLDIPEEFLRDPSSWVEADQMESFLKNANQLFGQTAEDGDLLEKVGQASSKLRSWGALDSVLKMMTTPEDLYSQPDRLLSYFISPPPPLSVSEKGKGYFSFETNIANYDFPYVTKYLESALSAVPTYVGHEACEVKWDGNIIHFRWGSEQSAFNIGMGENIRPELFQSLVSDLEKKQKELESKNRELLEKNRLLETTQSKLEASYREKIFSEKLSGLSELASSIAHEINNPLTYVTSNLSRLNDYIVRAQQLVTILVGQDRETPQVKEAMRRMDWAHMVHDFPQVVKEAHIGLQKVRDIVKDLSFLTGQSQSETRIPVDLEQLIDQAVKMVRMTAPRTIQIESHFFLERKIPVYPVRLEQALVNILNNAVQSIDGMGMVRIVTRPKGQNIEIEISDTGVGMDNQKLKNIFKPFYTTKSAGRGTGLGLTISHSIIEMHSGRIHVTSEVGVGSTFTIELPAEIENTHLRREESLTL